MDGYATHDVLNQPGALEGYNAYAGDQALVEAARVFGRDMQREPESIHPYATQPQDLDTLAIVERARAGG